MNAPLVRILSRDLVFEYRENEVFPNGRAGIEEQWPGWEDHVHGIGITITGDF